ncbi:MAG: hypothetical protein PHW52_02955, partial [Candidatus Pacebacteria bacterium]|nr:hypothetical protein [Candidatus Paceibacterota bacterium]
MCGTANGGSFTSLSSNSSNLCYSCYNTKEFATANFISTSTGWSWTCNSYYDGCNSGYCFYSVPAVCSAKKYTNGACGSANSSCTAGSLSDIADSGTAFLWNCLGSGGGSNASCSIPKAYCSSSTGGP